MKHLPVIAATLVLLAGLAGLPVLAAPCPDEFSSCANVPGKKCVLGTGGFCTTTDTGEQSCTEPDGSTFQCPAGQTIHINACPCRTRLQNQCCPECPAFTCGSCEDQPGSQAFFCAPGPPPPPCGPCLTHYCTGEGVGCQFNGTCGGGGCCNYTCGVSIPSCTGIDPCPSGACSC